jgi:hypothetical protein
MSRDIDAHNKPVFDELHPRIYAVAAGLLVWFALMAWVLFALSLIWRKYQLPYERHEESSFHDWRAGDFVVWGAKLHGAEAVIDVLLPLIAVSFGLTAIGIVFVIVRASTLS